MNNIILFLGQSKILKVGSEFEIKTELEKCKEMIFEVLHKYENLKLLTIICDSVNERELFQKYIGECKVQIDYISLDTKHISKNLNEEENYFNTLIRLIVQIIKINERENIKTKFIFSDIFKNYKGRCIEEIKHILNLINDMYLVEMVNYNSEKNLFKKVTNCESNYNEFKKYYQILKSIYRYGYVLEETIEKSTAIQLKYVIEDNSGMYRLTPLGEGIFEKIYNMNNFIDNDSNKYKDITVSKYMNNILESLAFQKYIQEVDIVYINEYVSENFFDIDDNNYIVGNICDGKVSYSLKIKINIDYDITDACIDLEKRYCKKNEKVNVPLTEFILIRHADDLGESENRIAGCYDFDITPKGEQQVELLVDRLIYENIKVNYIYTSPLKRAKKTADRISMGIGAEVIDYDALSGSNYGYSSGMTKREALIKYPNPREGYIPSSNIWEKESEIEYSCRVVKAFYNIYQSNIGKRIMIVTHGRAISSIMREVMSLPASKEVWIKCDDTSIHQFVIGNDFVEIIRINDSMHLNNKKSNGDEL